MPNYRFYKNISILTSSKYYKITFNTPTKLLKVNHLIEIFFSLKTNLFILDFQDNYFLHFKFST